MLTSSNHPGDLRDAYDLGANSYIVKTASLETRVEFAHALKSDWLQCNRVPV